MSRPMDHHFLVENKLRSHGQCATGHDQAGRVNDALILRDEDAVSGHATDEPDISIARVLWNRSVNEIRRQADNIRQFHAAFPLRIFSEDRHTLGSDATKNDVNRSDIIFTNVAELLAVINSPLTFLRAAA